jgi:hypothetical protein
MQNEITELRNQVRTLKRIVYGFGCLFVAGVVVSATNIQPSPTNSYPNVIKAHSIEVDSIVANSIIGNTIEALSEIKTVRFTANNIISQRTIADSIEVKQTMSSPRFEVLNSSNKPIAALCRGSYGAELRLGNNAGVRVITLGLDVDGVGGGLWFDNILASGAVNVSTFSALHVGTDIDGGFMRIRNKKNEIVTDLFVDSSGSGRITIK